MVQALDEELSGRRQRTLEKTYPYLVADARYEYIREDGRAESEGVLTVKGINQEGFRETLGLAVAPSEEETSWSEVCADLLDRKLGPNSVQYVVSDEHRDLKSSFTTILSWSNLAIPILVRGLPDTLPTQCRVKCTSPCSPRGSSLITGLVRCVQSRASPGTS